ncbi:DUF305 domain-containing protein [Streptomyces bambusae]|uniref:DUF305 domain-containing protein n=1 Tax=Streptomyces bambusae TaxID=1550616 RepID=UPI001CFCC544|nr:DUF305 domain-containing protein [Streptomyces bambusae]MCB5166679.1 DUF305 domain-containing protein [Streptomyces bambusae]
MTERHAPEEDALPIHRRLAQTLAAALLALALAGCEESGDRAADPEPTGGARVIAPGKPGEKSRTLTPGEAAKELPDDSPNAADHQYVRRMIEHHRQALTMTALAPGRAASTQVKRLAERIAAAQKPEIGAMEGWQSAHPADPGAAGHDHAMPGMATAEQLGRLKAARGAEFDRQFLALMIAHHEGAVTMAGEALSGGNNVAVEEMATDVVAQQTAEISRMRAMG